MLEKPEKLHVLRGHRLDVKRFHAAHIIGWNDEARPHAQRVHVDSAVLGNQERRTARKIQIIVDLSDDAVDCDIHVFERERFALPVERADVLIFPNGKRETVGLEWIGNIDHNDGAGHNDQTAVGILRARRFDHRRSLFCFVLGHGERCAIERVGRFVNAVEDEFGNAVLVFDVFIDEFAVFAFMLDIFFGCFVAEPILGHFDLLLIVVTGFIDDGAAIACNRNRCDNAFADDLFVVLIAACAARALIFANQIALRFARSACRRRFRAPNAFDCHRFVRVVFVNPSERSRLDVNDETRVFDARRQAIGVEAVRHDG